jgi:hypothetical protein
LSLINPKALSGEDLEIDAKAFIDLVQTLYVGHVFKRDQKFVVSFFGQYLLCKVMSMDATDEAFLKGKESKTTSKKKVLVKKNKTSLFLKE